MNDMSTQELPLRVVFPDVISGAAVDSEDEGHIGLLIVRADDDTLRLAFRPAEIRQLAALWMNMADEVDSLERSCAARA
jgi:hypothetical protein